MRARQNCFPAAAIVFALAVGVSAHAQIAPCLSESIWGGGVVYGIGGSDNAPFSGTVKASFEQKLADGNVIRFVTLTHQARDSAGRTMTERAMGCARGEDGQMHERLSVNVMDVPARTSMSWQVGPDIQPKVVQVFHMPEPLPRQTVRAEQSPEQIAQREKVLEAARAQQLQSRKENRTEDLGIQQINGIAAKGTRNTRTIPVGEEGNEQPLVVVSETWRSKELGLVLKVINDDPRHGRTTTEYEELIVGEPDPGVFAVPAGYTLRELRPQNGIDGIVQ